MRKVEEGREGGSEVVRNWLCRGRVFGVVASPRGVWTECPPRATVLRTLPVAILKGGSGTVGVGPGRIGIVQVSYKHLCSLLKETNPLFNLGVPSTRLDTVVDVPRGPRTPAAGSSPVPGRAWVSPTSVTGSSSDGCCHWSRLSDDGLQSSVPLLLVVREGGRVALPGVTAQRVGPVGTRRVLSHPFPGVGPSLQQCGGRYILAFSSSLSKRKHEKGCTSSFSPAPGTTPHSTPNPQTHIEALYVSP